MSFRCERCGEAQDPGVRPTVVTVKTRPVEYHDPVTGEVIGRGRETVSELNMCPNCAKKSARTGVRRIRIKRKKKKGSKAGPAHDPDYQKRYPYWH